ncbi:MAG: DUF5368 family protein [Alphaproteobacteria bacterium]|nr:DUF5368 family protein [Alphaproteobacteria bacterium]
MKEIDLATILAVFEEMLGPMLWVLVALALLATIAFVFVLVRDRGLRPRRLVWAEAAGVAGGIAAVLFMQFVTSSSFADIGGPIDWVLVAAIFAAGAIGTMVGIYALLGLGRWRG